MLKLTSFSGIRPKISARLLRENEAQTADNCKLFSGELRSWNRPLIVATPTKAADGTVRSIFRMNDGTTDFWLNWLDDVDCVRGPIAGDETQRIYYTGDGEPRVSNLALATTGVDFPAAAHVLGVYRPATAPSLAVTGGVGVNVTRAYVYTFKTPWGEEGQPSPPTTLSGKVDGSWDLSAMESVPPNSGTVSGATYTGGKVTVAVDTTRGLRAGEEVTHASVTGMTDLNGTFPILEVVDATHYKVALTTAQTYTAGGTWARVATHNTTGMTKCIYRVLTTTTGADFQLVAEITGTTTTYSDTVADSALGEVLASTDWAMPPADMRGIMFLSNGIGVGFSKNEVCLSEPFRPHAWPSAYRQSTTRPIVSLGNFSTTVVVTTLGEPWVLTGNTPDSMVMDKIERMVEPCLSKRGTISTAFGVIWPSPNGWMIVGVGGATLASEDVLTLDEFAAFFPATLTAAEYQGRYFAWYTDDSGSVRGVIFDRSGQGPTLVPLQQSADAAWTDPETAALYIVHDGYIKKWDGDTLNKLPYEWKSRVSVFSSPTNPGAVRVDADYGALSASDAEDAQAALDAAYNADILAGSESWPGQGVTRGEFDSNMLEEFMLEGSLLRDSFTVYDTRSLQFELYANDELIWTEVLEDRMPFRLPAGYEETEFVIRISGNINVRMVKMAETMDKLELL